MALRQHRGITVVKFKPNSPDLGFPGRPILKASILVFIQATRRGRYVPYIHTESKSHLVNAVMESLASSINTGVVSFDNVIPTDRMLSRAFLLAAPKNPSDSLKV